MGMLGLFPNRVTLPARQQESEIVIPDLQVHALKGNRFLGTILLPLSVESTCRLSATKPEVDRKDGGTKLR